MAEERRLPSRSEHSERVILLEHERSECEEQDLNLRTTKDQPLKLASLAA